jgi:hypothetical protein
MKQCPLDRCELKEEESCYNCVAFEKEQCPEKENCIWDGDDTWGSCYPDSNTKSKEDADAYDERKINPGCYGKVSAPLSETPCGKEKWCFWTAAFNCVDKQPLSSEKN